MSSWDLSQLRRSVERLYGRAQRIAISPSLDSIDQRRNYASYHYHEAFRVMKDATCAHESDMELMMLIMGAIDDEASQEFKWASFQASAHIIACVQSMHTYSDLLAHSIYYAFGMNLYENPLKARQIGMNKVFQLLPSGEVKKQVSVLINHADFSYLSAVTNHSKHRSIVEATYSLDLTSDPVSSHGLKFSGFEYDGKTYSERWVKSILESEYNRQAELVVRIGQAINAAVEVRN